MKRTISWTVVLMFALYGPHALAQGNSQGHGNGHGKGNPHNQWRDDDDRDNGRWESRSGWEYRTYEGDKGPPGWNKGKKTGWGNCNLPPGQAKKYGCNTYSYGGRQYYWYRDNVGRIVVRRPVISAHAGVEIH
jgi:hypothetical protein